MKEGWEYKKLGEVAEVIHGKNQKDVLSEGGQYPIYGSGGNIMGYANDYLCEAGTTILGRKGSINNPQFIEERFWNVDTAFGISAKEGYDSKFVYYFITSINWLKKNTGTTLPSLTQQVVKSVELPIPSFSEQQSIVDYLDSAFAKIDAMKANAEKALNEAKALFQASLKEMLEPKEGWEEKKLLSLTSKIGSGATPKGGRKVYIEKGCHLIRSMNIQYNEFKYEDLAHITDEAANQLNGVEIQEDDVLFNITGASIARCCVVPADVLPARVNQHVSILRLKQEVLPRFLSYIMNSPNHQKRLLEIGETGSTRQALTKTDLENHTICYPTIECQNKIICALNSLKSKVDKLQANYDRISQECDVLKQAILRQVFE